MADQQQQQQQQQQGQEQQQQQQQQLPPQQIAQQTPQLAPQPNNVIAHSNNGMPITVSSGSSPRGIPNSPLAAQHLASQAIPQVQVIPQGMNAAGQYVQFMFAPQNPAALAMQASGVNFAMAQQRPPAAHSGVGPRSPAMLGVVPPSPSQMAGMHLVSPSPNPQPLSLTSPSKTPVRAPPMSPSVANVTGQRVIAAESFQQMQQLQQQQQQYQQQQNVHQQQQQAKFYIRPIGSGMQLVSQQPTMSSQAGTLQGQSPVGTVAPSTQAQMMSQPQIISTQPMLGSQPIYGQLIPQSIPVAHQQYISNQGQAVLTTQPMYVRPTMQNQQPIQNPQPVNMTPKVGRPRLDQSQRKTPPGVSLAAKRQATGQARVTPIASRMSKSNTPPINLSLTRQLRPDAPKQIRARLKAPVQMMPGGGLAINRPANLVRVPQPSFIRVNQNKPATPESVQTSTEPVSNNIVHNEVSREMPDIVSTVPPSATNGDAEPDVEKQKAVVKPQTLTHIIDGFVIEEGPLAFPVQASSLITDTNDLPPKLSRVSSRESEEEVFKPAPPGNIQAPAKAVEEEPKLKCEFCGKVDKMTKFRRSKRFCSVGCAKRYNVNSRHKGLKKVLPPTTTALGTGFVRKKKQLMIKRSPWKRGQGARLAVSRIPQAADQADDEHSTTSSSCSSQHDVEDRSSSMSTPVGAPQEETTRNNPAKWTVQEVYNFVKSMGGCEPYADAFKSQEIDGQALMLLKEDHLMSAMNMKLGPALKICARINTMKMDTS